MDKSFTEIAGYEKEKKELQNLQEFLVNIRTPITAQWQSTAKRL